MFPIRVAGWQPDAEGRSVVYARTDQLIAGLDRAVDPDGDGDAHDAARIALVGLAEPFASFADSPESRAVAGALALDTLVVAPAGNDGAAGPLYGSLAGPGRLAGARSPSARPTSGRRPSSVHVVMRRGLDVVLDEELPLLAAAALDAAAASSRSSLPRGEGTATEDWFDARGFSLVAGRAALVGPGQPTRARPRSRPRAAGAAAVLVYGKNAAVGRARHLQRGRHARRRRAGGRRAHAAPAHGATGYEIAVAVGGVALASRTAA